MEALEKQNLENLLNWCNDISSYWEVTKPVFSRSLSENDLGDWEDLHKELKNKVAADLNEDYDHFQKANDLYERLNEFCSKLPAAEDIGG